MIAHNLSPSELADGDYAALFEQRRRDALFAGAFPQPDGSTIALRDHMGAVGLFYRRTPQGWRFALDMAELIEPTDTLDTQGLRYYLSNGSSKSASFIAEIDLVPPGTVLRFTPEAAHPETLYRYLPTPVAIPRGTPLRDIIARTGELLARAVERTVRADSVGLYLSGGIDSYLIGKHLTRLGVRVTGYTSATWGLESTELPFARINAEKIGTAAHHIDVLHSEAYAHAMQAIPAWYGVPLGITTAIGVVGLWENTPISTEKQVYFGQNADTIFGATPAQYLVYFVTRAPRFVQAQLLEHTYPQAYRTFLAFRTQGLINDHPSMAHIRAQPKLSDYASMALAAMLITNAGEVMSMPAIRRGIAVGNPFHDMDLIEFGLGIPLRHVLSFSPEPRRPLKFEKRPLQHLVLGDLAPEHIYRKKGFSVSLRRDAHTTALIDTLPQQMAGIPLRDVQNRFAAGLLEPWLRQRLASHT